MGRKPKPPYPWKSLAKVVQAGFTAAYLAVFMLLFGTRVLTVPIDGLPTPPWFNVLSIIMVLVGANSLVLTRLREHRGTMKKVRHEWEEQTTGDAPLLRPAAQTDETLLRTHNSTNAADVEETNLLRASLGEPDPRG